MEFFETVAFVMRYWFILVFVVIFACTAIVCFSEFKEKRRILSYAGSFIGYLELVYSPYGDAEDGVRLALDAENMIGRADTNDLVINEPSVGRRHARIFKRTDGVYVMGLKGCNVALNGERINAPTQVFSDDIIELGGIEFRLSLKEDATEGDA